MNWTDQEKTAAMMLLRDRRSGHCSQRYLLPLVKADNLQFATLGAPLRQTIVQH